MPADLILDDDSVTISDGMLSCDNDAPIQARFEGPNDTKVILKSGKVEMSVRDEGGTLRSAVLSPLGLSVLGGLRAASVSAESVDGGTVQVGRGTASEPRDPGMLSVEDGRGNATVRIDGEHANMRLGHDGADGDIWLRDQNDRTTIELDSGSGQRKFNSTKIHIDGKNGTIQLTGGVTDLSDARCKQDVESLSGALDKVTELRGVSFRWKQGEGCPDHGPERKIGLIAQEVREVVPEVVSEDARGRYSVTYAGLVPMLVEAVKEQQQLLDRQDRRLAEMERRIAALESVEAPAV